jgi:hypothetical protein
VVVEGATSWETPIDLWTVVRRDVGCGVGEALWSAHHQIEPGEEILLGRLPRGARVDCLAMGRDPEWAAAWWTVEAAEVRRLELGEGPPLRLRVERATDSPRPLILSLVPPAPAAEMWYQFPSLRDRLTRSMGPSASTVEFGALPMFQASGPWRVRAARDGDLLRTSPETVLLSNESADHELDIRLEEVAGGTVVRGRVLDATTGLPVPAARIGLMEPGMAGWVALANDAGEYRLDTRRRLPLPLYFEATGYRPWSTSIDVEPDDGSGRVVDARLMAYGEEDCDVSVSVGDVDGNPLAGARCVWHVDGAPLGRAVAGRDGLAAPIRVPRGEASLVVEPPLGRELPVHRGTYAIVTDQTVVVRLDDRRECQVCVQLSGPGAWSGGLQVLLTGAQSHRGDVSRGGCTIERVRSGTYALHLLVGEGATIPLGVVHVDEHFTRVYRSLDALTSVSVTLASATPAETATARASDVPTGHVVGTRRMEGAAVQWVLPRGEYEFEVVEGSRRGGARVRVPEEVVDGSVTIGTSMGVGGLVVPVVAAGPPDPVLLSVRVSGPVVRTWETSARLEDGRTRVVLDGLPPGRYEVAVALRPMGAPATALVEVGEGRTAETPPLVLGPAR